MKNPIQKVISRINDLPYNVSVKNIPRIKYDIKKIRDEGYFSQDGQDKFVIEELLNFSRLGCFIDIGANDGITINNTYYMEKNLGWTGIAIEPIPKVYDALKAARTCITINGCVSEFTGTVKFLELEGECEMLSGIVDNYDKRHLQRIKNEQEQFGGTKRYIDVPCFTLQSILEKYQIKKVDYLTIDTEGGELKVLETIKNTKDIQIQIINVENNYRERKFQRFLKKYNYKLVALIGADEIYQKE